MTNLKNGQKIMENQGQKFIGKFRIFFFVCVKFSNSNRLHSTKIHPIWVKHFGFSDKVPGCWRITFSTNYISAMDLTSHTWTHHVIT